MEQNNVPVIYDGTSIKEIVNYYFLTNKSSGITFSKSTWQADGWKKESQNVSRTNRYLWCVSETIYTNTKNGESGNLTEPIIISVFGEQGERGAIYLGHYASTSNAYSDNEDDISSGDYFLNTADSFIYVYDKDANTWTKISDYSDYRYNQSINDIFENITDSTAKETFIKAKSIWVQNLAAAVARTNLLFSNEITLTSGTDLSGKTTSGKIHSANYKSGTSGWQIDYAGNAEFNNATIRGAIKGGTINIGENFSVDENGNIEANKGTFNDDCIFAGSIASGPLYLDEENPTSIESQLTFSAGDSTQNFWETIKDISYSTAVNGIITYNNSSSSFSHIQKQQASGGYGMNILFKNKKLNSVNWKKVSNSEESTLYMGWTAKGSSDITSYATLPCDITLNLYNPKGKTLKLIDLPTSAASESGYLYKDSEGYLRIS